MNSDRRLFLRKLASLGFTTASLNLLIPAAGHADSAARSAIKKSIPSSSEALPVIGMGTSRTFDVSDDRTMFQQLQQVLEIFFANGGTLIDSSPMYGNAEQVVGRLMQATGLGEKMFAATKVWTSGEQEGIEQMQASMRKMQVERFDLMQIHNLVDWRTHLKTLDAWKAEGKIRYTGITTSHGRDHAELLDILQKHVFDFVQLSYNIEDREVEKQLLPIAQERGIAVLVNRPFQRGGLFRRIKGKALPDWAGEINCDSWAQFFLKYVVSHPAVNCVIPATTKPHHMQDNMSANFGRLPDAKMRTEMENYFNRV